MSGATCVRVPVFAMVVLCSSMAAQAVVVDGDLAEWTAADRLDTVAGSGVTGYDVYGRYEGGTYFVAIRSDGTVIGEATTVWLNTDQNAATGYQVFGFAGGAEFNVNFFTDAQPYLYTGADGESFVNGPLPHAYGSGGTVVELAIDETLLGIATPPQDIDVLIDVNNSVFLPPDYSLFVYTIATGAPGTIVVDGDLADWGPADLLGGAPEVPPGWELYGRKVDTDYVIALRTDGPIVGSGTTIWINTDEDAATGYQIFGFAGGAEFNVNHFTDDLPYLYTGAAGQNFVTGPLVHAFGGGGTILELSIPEGLLTVPASSQQIGLLLDVNNSVFLPPDYSTGFQFPIATGNTPAIPTASGRGRLLLVALLAASLVVRVVVARRRESPAA